MSPLRRSLPTAGESSVPSWLSDVEARRQGAVSLDCRVNQPPTISRAFLQQLHVLARLQPRLLLTNVLEAVRMLPDLPPAGESYTRILHIVCAAHKNWRSYGDLGCCLSIPFLVLFSARLLARVTRRDHMCRRT